MEALLGLARDAGLEVRIVHANRGSDVEIPPASGTCRVRGEVWVVLSTSDPMEVRLEVLADALRHYDLAPNRAELVESICRTVYASLTRG